MKTPLSFERRLSDWLEDGPADAPDQILETILAAVPSIPQRRAAVRVPWRYLPMNGYTRALAGVAAVVAIALGALLIVPRLQPGNVGGPSGPTPPASPPAPSPTATPLPSPTPLDPATWQAFASTRHGYRTTYPTDWTVKRATAPWPAGTDAAAPPDPMLDVFTGPDGAGPIFVVVSQPLPAGVTGSAWLASYETNGGKTMPAACWPTADKMESISIGNWASYVHGGLSGCGFTEAITFVGGRVYEMTGYTASSPNQTGVFDRALFDAFLWRLTFEPSQADDRPVVSPGPS